jgi:hypothetical protein
MISAMPLLFGFTAYCGPLVSTESPLAFFTNLASRLLRSELNLDLNWIQVYPTNQYTPAVHRLLQVTVNIYDAATNQTGTMYPQLPTVFRPLFRRDNHGLVYIVGYREVTDSRLASPKTEPRMLDLDNGTNDVLAVPPLGAPPPINDSNEPLVSGVPLVVGVRKGLPNFNEFSMQTTFFISRLLQFRRASDGPAGPIVQTNQMYIVALTNAFGLEAWNSYSNSYPRNLAVLATLDMTAILTNELGQVLLSNRVSRGTSLFVTTNGWPGWTNYRDLHSSFLLPWGDTNNCTFLANSTYLNQPPRFEPQTGAFQRQTGFDIPFWWLVLNTRVRFALVDTDADRIVDYVNLNNWEQPLDIHTMLTTRDPSEPNDYHDPGHQWLTNRVGDSASTLVPTYGIVNQILLGLSGTTEFNSFSFDPLSGQDAESAVDSFRYNLMGWSPIYPKDQAKTFYKSNIFYAPFDPYRPIYLHTSWQANDPLVHYTMGDLLDLSRNLTNRVDFYSHNPPLDNIGQPNARYEPWGGNPFGFTSVHSIAPADLAAKDPLIIRADAWDFPSEQSLSVGWLGRVHRGTPWQTLFLKSTNLLLRAGGPAENLAAWQRWTGNGLLDPAQDGNSPPVPDAAFTTPTNDWRLVSLLAALFNTNDVHNLASVNQSDEAAWSALLDGMTVLTNPAPGQLDPVAVCANSPQVATIIAAINATRSSQPGQVFFNVGDILATPELSVASPWLNPAGAISDEAYEILPAQLLPRLRPDSIGSVTQTGEHVEIQFTGLEGFPYEIETSTDLVDWTVVSINYPNNGFFALLINHPLNSSFYRSRLVTQSTPSEDRNHPHHSHKKKSPWERK